MQALYQMDLAETDLAEVIEEFKAHRLGARRRERHRRRQADAGAFRARAARAWCARQREIDPLIDQQLATGWRLVRIDSIVRAILRAGAFELMELPDVPAARRHQRVHRGGARLLRGRRAQVVNGVLDQLARKLRPGELPERG